jgi:hypothetical protein
MEEFFSYKDKKVIFILIEYGSLYPKIMQQF